MQTRAWPASSSSAYDLFSSPPQQHSLCNFSQDPWWHRGPPRVRQCEDTRQLLRGSQHSLPDDTKNKGTHLQEPSVPRDGETGSSSFLSSRAPTDPPKTPFSPLYFCTAWLHPPSPKSYLQLHSLIFCISLSSNIYSSYCPPQLLSASVSTELMPVAQQPRDAHKSHS